MSAPEICCPICLSALTTGPDADGRNLCPTCDESAPGQSRSPDTENRTSTRIAARESAVRRAGRAGLFVVAAVGVLTVAMLGAAGFVALRSNPPKEQAAADTNVPPAPPAPPRTPDPVPPTPPRQEEPSRAEPPKPAPPAPTPDQIVRRVKGATVYIRSTQSAGRVTTGTGFFAGRPGFVVTNAHVVGYGPGGVRPPTRLEVVVASGEADERTLTAEVYGADSSADLALLRVDGGPGADPLPFGRAADLVETHEVVIYGYPFGEQLGKNISVNRTTVSSLRKEGGKLVRIQLAGGLHPGNSGGPVTNARGEVVGVSVARLRGAETIGFAIPAETADAFVADQHRTGGRFDFGGPVPAGPPLVLPPVVPVPITPAEVDAGGTVVELPGTGTDVCVGGGGRFLLVTLPRAKQVAVVDLCQAKVVKCVPLDAERALVAAGMSALVIVYPDTNVVQRWSLTTFEKEATAELPTTAKLVVTGVAMGSASNGPLFVQSLDWPRLGERFLFDVTTMAEVRGSRARDGYQGVTPGDVVRAGADGRVMTVTRKEGGACGFVLRGPRWAEYPVPWESRGQPALVSADGQTVYGSGEMAATTGKWVGGPGREGAWYLPAAHGPLVLAATDLGAGAEGGRGLGLTVHLPRDPKPLFALPRLAAVDALLEPKGEWAVEGRVFLVPKARVVAVLPRSRDRIVLYPADVDAGLAKADRDYLFVASHPPSAVPGRRFVYHIEARSKRGDVTYRVDTGPDGLTVGPDGTVTWPVPTDFATPVSVAVAVSDKSGQSVNHAFELVSTTVR